MNRYIAKSPVAISIIANHGLVFFSQPNNKRQSRHRRMLPPISSQNTSNRYGTPIQTPAPVHNRTSNSHQSPIASRTEPRTEPNGKTNEKWEAVIDVPNLIVIFPRYIAFLFHAFLLQRWLPAFNANERQSISLIGQQITILLICWCWVIGKWAVWLNGTIEIIRII